MDRKRGQQPTDAGRREEPFKTKKSLVLPTAHAHVAKRNK